MNRESNPFNPSADASPFWEQPCGISPVGIGRETITPAVEHGFLRVVSADARRLFGDHWFRHKAALAELHKLTPDGLKAMAQFCARPVVEFLPEAGITETVLWDAYALQALRVDHEVLEPHDTFAAYLKHRMGHPGWREFQRSAMQILDQPEPPEFRERLLFCMMWDLYPLPLRFWADAATSALWSFDGRILNRDKIRQVRRELGLRRDSPTIVKSFIRGPAANGEGNSLTVEIDDRTAVRSGLSAVLHAFCDYLKRMGGVQL